MSFFFSSASLVSFVTMMTYVLAGNRLTAQKVFTCVSLFNGSRLVMTLFFPIAVTLMNEGRVSLERMEVSFHELSHPMQFILFFVLYIVLLLGFLLILCIVLLVTCILNKLYLEEFKIRKLN